MKLRQSGGSREHKLKQEGLIVKPVYSVMNPKVYFGRKSEVLCNFLQRRKTLEVANISPPAADIGFEVFDMGPN